SAWQGRGVLRVPQEAGGVPEHPRRQQEHAPDLHAPGDVQAAVRTARAGRKANAAQARRDRRRPEAMRGRWIAVAALAVLPIAAYMLTGLTQIRPGERAVIRRFGRVLPEQPGPGLWFGLPWGMERVDRVAMEKVRRVEVGYDPEEDDTGMLRAGQMLTG